LTTPHEPILIDLHILNNPKSILNAADSAFMTMFQKHITEVPLDQRTYGSSRSQ